MTYYIFVSTFKYPSSKKYDQLKKPKKTGTIEALEKTWKEAVQRGFNTPYVIGEFKNKKEEIGSE